MYKKSWVLAFIIMILIVFNGCNYTETEKK